jgi:argininosuccinate synthase
LLFDAYRRLESACLPAEWIREKLHVEQIWVREAVEGRWFGSLRSAAQAFIAVLADAVTGSISYRIELNHFRLTSMAAENRHYIRDRRDYEAAGVHGIDEPKGQ